MTILKTAGKLLGVCLLLLLALGADYLMFLFTNTCAACTTFSQFMASPASVSGPIMVTAGSLTVTLKNLTLKSFKQLKSA